MGWEVIVPLMWIPTLATVGCLANRGFQEEEDRYREEESRSTVRSDVRSSNNGLIDHFLQCQQDYRAERRKASRAEESVSGVVERFLSCQEGVCGSMRLDDTESEGGTRRQSRRNS
jgi:hypothetical protein